MAPLDTTGALLVQAGGHGAAEVHTGEHVLPSLFWSWPFVALLLAIAVLPLLPRTHHWWEHNRNKLLVALSLAAVTLLYYLFRGFGFHSAEAGLSSVGLVLKHAVLDDFVPFIVLLFSLYTISGGINLRGDLPAHPLTNCVFLLLGALLASVVGTTGAAMLLIRPLLQINSERKHVTHTVVFFIFLVANIGGSLLPIGDPPLFLGYLRGVPFLWTLNLWMEWAFMVLILLLVYYVWDKLAYRREAIRDVVRDETTIVPLSLRGKFNFLLLVGVILAVALLVPGKTLPGTSWVVPHGWFFREQVQILLAALSLKLTPRAVREANRFNFVAIGEVAALFIGIFITMQVPIEILQAKGPELGLHRPWQFFWATGTLSSFLDNAPTYVVFFETAGALSLDTGQHVISGLATATGRISMELLVAISLGSVFMGANTYIGNGPNFMVKSIAEYSGIKMPSFFGYMLYSIGILVPLFLLVTWLFMR
ncbi:sodium:proton antiporter [bacterium]|nr:sodium:proton antiporter [bacterium]